MGTQTVLELLIDAADELSVQHEWSSAFGAYNEGDTSDRKLLRALSRTCREISRRLEWQIATAEQTFVTVAGETQAASLWKPADFQRFVKGSPSKPHMWDRTSNLPVIGPLSSDEWQQFKAGWAYSSYPAFYERGDAILLQTAPGVGHTIAFEYITNAIGENASNERLSQFTADTDVPLWDDELLILGTIYNYRKMQRYEYASDQMAFEQALVDHYKSDGGTKVFNMGKGAPRSSDDLVANLKGAVISISGS